VAVFEVTIGLLLLAGLLVPLAGRLGLPYPSLLALAGTVAAFLPGLPEATVEPELVLALFVAPVLLDAAFDASPRDLRANFRAVLSLALVAVGVTIAAVAIAARLMVPEMPWAVAIALGAIVAPPDASAASAILRQLRLPHRLTTILEGESLFNDATALLIYRFAVAAAGTGMLPLSALPLQLVLTCGGGVLLGIVLARLYFRLSGLLMSELPVWVMLQFLMVFGVWLLAEALRLSAIITVVAFAMTLARLAPQHTGARRRIAAYAVWEVAVFVLNALAFLFIGLQFRAALGRIDGSAWQVAVLALVVLAVVILARFGWVMAWLGLGYLRRWRRGPPMKRGAFRGTLLISWCGMRGIVTLATALALPPDFPFRDMIVLSAVTVAVGTLVLQGLTLRPLLLWLRLERDDTVARETREARIRICEAGLRALERDPERDAAAALREEFAARLAAARDGSGDAAEVSGPAAVLARAVVAKREALVALRSEGVIGDDAFHAVEEEIDLLELTADPRLRPPAAAG